MDNLESTMETLRQLRKKHGRVLSLTLVFKCLLKTRLYRSKETIANCLRALQKAHKIKPINFGVDIELLESVKQNSEYVQSSLNGYGIKKSV